MTTPSRTATPRREALIAPVPTRARRGRRRTLVMRPPVGQPEVRVLLAAGDPPRATAGRNAADRARDGIADPRKARATVEATGRPRDYALVLKLLTDE